MEIVKVESDFNLCRGCLSSDRNLLAVGDLGNVYRHLLGVQEIALQDVILCWECMAMLKKIKIFQKQVTHVNDILWQLNIDLDKVDKLSFSSLACVSKFYYDHTYEHGEDVITNTTKAEETKQECNTIKEEPAENILDYLDDNNGFDNTDVESDTVLDSVRKRKTNKLVSKRKYEDTTNYDSNGYELSDVKSETIKAVRRKKKRNTYTISYNQRYKDVVDIKDHEPLDWNDLDKYYTGTPLHENDIEKHIDETDRKECSYKDLPYRCEICHLGYKRMGDWKRHNSLNHTKEGNYSCVYCKKKVATSQEFRIHWLEHSVFKKCNICGTYCYGSTDFVKHLKRYHVRTYQCTVCRAEFGTLKEFNSHYSSDHGFFCDYCGREAKTKYAIAKHIKAMHTPVTCVACSKVFKSGQKLRQHYQHDHAANTESELSYCVECDRQFPTVSRYKRHLMDSCKHNKALKIFRFPCPVCGRLFNRKTYMNNHYQKIHMKVTKNHCKICNKYYANGFGLRTHIQRIHQKMQPNKNKICDLCGRGFSVSTHQPYPHKPHSHAHGRAAAQVRALLRQFCAENRA